MIMALCFSETVTVDWVPTIYLGSTVGPAGTTSELFLTIFLQVKVVNSYGKKNGSPRISGLIKAI